MKYYKTSFNNISNCITKHGDILVLHFKWNNFWYFFSENCLQVDLFSRLQGLTNNIFLQFQIFHLNFAKVQFCIMWNKKQKQNPRKKNPHTLNSTGTIPHKMVEFSHFLHVWSLTKFIYICRLPEVTLMQTLYIK